MGWSRRHDSRFKVDEYPHVFTEFTSSDCVIHNVGDSNVVLRFNGWIDQNDTEFLKARSLAIQATKASLNVAGFALPEPIYRLRFDESASYGNPPANPQRRIQPVSATPQFIN